MPEFLMPRLGADMTAGKVVAWLKQPGERVERGDIIAVVETDKANVDVESFIAGVLEKILVQPGGDPLPVGTPLALIRSEAGAEPAAVTAVPPPTPPQAAAVSPAAVSPAVVPAAWRPAAAGGERVRISPAARKRALELRLNSATLAGTGPEGRVTLADVERAAQGAPAQPAPADTSAARQLRMREAIASAMARSKREIPHYYLACRGSPSAMPDAP
jgi:pyruvate dehydrogenase E2 component (dihydrolipoamide acetyltransferase)